MKANRKQTAVKLAPSKIGTNEIVRVVTKYGMVRIEILKFSRQCGVLLPVTPTRVDQVRSRTDLTCNGTPWVPRDSICSVTWLARCSFVFPCKSCKTMHIENCENEVRCKAVKPYKDTLCYQNINGPSSCGFERS